MGTITEHTRSGDEAKPAKARPAASEVAGKPKLTNYRRIRKIEETLEAIRPSLQRDHGDITLVVVDGKKIDVELTGVCRGCSMEAATLGGVHIAEEVDRVVAAVPPVIARLRKLSPYWRGDGPVTHPEQAFQPEYA